MSVDDAWNHRTAGAIQDGRAFGHQPPDIGIAARRQDLAAGHGQSGGSAHGREDPPIDEDYVGIGSHTCFGCQRVRMARVFTVL